MKRTVSVLAFVVAALCIAPVSQAQNAPPSAPAPAATPAPQPPPNYPPPPPRYPSGGYPQNPPPGQWAPAQPRQWAYAPEVAGVYRPFSFTLGVGPGYMHGTDTREVGLSYNLFRLGFGIVPNVQFYVAFEGMGANTTSLWTGEYSWLHQENYLLGIQGHFLRRLYVRGGVGAGVIGERTDTTSIPGPGTGLAVSGGIGYEFVQTPHVALALEANGSLTKYARSKDGSDSGYWGTTGLNLAVSFY